MLVTVGTEFQKSERAMNQKVVKESQLYMPPMQCSFVFPRTMDLHDAARYLNSKIFANQV